MTSVSSGPGSRSRRSLRPLALVTAVVVWCVAGALLPAAASAQSPYGILLNEIDHTTPRAEIAARMDIARQANAGWIRLDFYWYSVEWTRGAFNWTYFDTLVQEADARGLSIIATLGWPARWAVTDGVAYYGVPEMAAWERFVSQAAARYRGWVGIWEIWNEPDKPYYWRGTPAKYAELLARAYTKIKAADPEATVALGGLAQGGTSLVADFLPQILSNGTYPAGRYFDVHNIHTNFRTASLITSQVSSNRAILSQYGLQKPIIATEASYTSDSAHQTLTGYIGGGEATQARYLVDAYNAMLANGIEIAVWATGVDYGNGSGAYAASGLTRSDFRAKQAYTAFRNLAGSTAAPAAPTPPGTVTNFRVVNPATGGRLNLSWTNPGDGDLSGVLVLRRTGSAVTDTPVTGRSYGAGQAVGSSTVVFAGSGTSFSNTSLANGTTYHYKAFAYDTGQLYGGGVSASGSPTAATVACRGEVIVDNGPAGQTDATRIPSGTWATSTVAGFHPPNASLYSHGWSSQETYTWKTPVLNASASCKYQVYVRWTSHANRTTAASYTVSGQSGGAVTRRFDQRGGGAQWILHGTYTFPTGTQGTVRLVEGPSGYTVADAVRFVLVP